LSNSKEALNAAHLGWLYDTSNHCLILLDEMLTSYIAIWWFLEFEPWINWCLVAVSGELFTKLVVQPVDIAVLDYPELTIHTVTDDAAAKVVMDVAKGLQFELITQKISNGLDLILC
jgi:hypothetical protein